MGWNKRRRELIRGNGNRGIKEPIANQNQNSTHITSELENDDFDRESFNANFGIEEEDKEMERFRDMTHDNFLGNEASDFDCDCEYEEDDYDYDYDLDRD